MIIAKQYVLYIMQLHSRALYFIEEWLGCLEIFIRNEWFLAIWMLGGLHRARSCDKVFDVVSWLSASACPDSPSKNLSTGVINQTTDVNGKLKSKRSQAVQRRILNGISRPISVIARQRKLWAFVIQYASTVGATNFRSSERRLHICNFNDTFNDSDYTFYCKLISIMNRFILKRRWQSNVVQASK